MQSVMFTKHLEGFDLEQIIAGIQRVGIDGADLCVRPGYPVNPENCRTDLPAAARRFADEGLGIAIVTTPGDFTDASVAGILSVLIIYTLSLAAKPVHRPSGSLNFSGMRS